MMRKRREVYVLGVVFALMSVAFVAQADISYIPVPVDAQSGFVEVGDPATGQARIEYNYWLDEPSSYWHYAYQIFNNDYSGTETDRTDDYHFGYEYDSGGVADTIHKFDLVFDPASGINDLEVVGWGGSDSGGTGWSDSKDYVDIFHPELGYSGLDWNVTEISGGQAIAPAQWYSSQGGKKWNNAHPGNASTDDSNGQYFQIASKWSPGLVGSSVVAGVNLTASGQVIGPSVIPEPATGITFALGTLGFLWGRRFIGFA